MIFRHCFLYKKLKLPGSGNIDFHVVETNVGNFVEVFELLVELTEPVVLFGLNRRLKRGFVMPDMQQIRMQNPEIEIENSTMRIGTSVLYIP